MELTGPFLASRIGVLAGLALPALVLGGAALAGVPIDRAWGWLLVDYGVWTMPGLVPFADLAILTHMLDCVPRGVDPYDSPSCDPAGRRFNYPQAWLLLGTLGLGSAHTTAIALAMIVVFALALVWLLPARTALGHALVFAAVISHPVLFLVERANIDLLMFAGCAAVAVLASRTRPRAARPLAVALVGVLFVAKLYPLAASAAFWRSRRTLIVAVAAAAAVAALYAVGAWDMLREVRRVTPTATDRSYGAAVLPLMAYQWWFDTTWVPPWMPLAGLLAALGTLALAWHLSTRLRPGLDAAVDDLDDPWLRLAIVGTALYGLTYCLGTNYDYRLAFLLMPLAWLLRWWERSARRGALHAALAIVALLWTSQARNQLNPVDDLLAWVVFLVGCAAMLALVRRLLAPRAAVGRAADRDEPARLTEACR